MGALRCGKPRLLRAARAEDRLRAHPAVADTGRPAKPPYPLPTQALQEIAMLMEAISLNLPKLEGFRSHTVPHLLSRMALEVGGFLPLSWHFKFRRYMLRQKK